MFDGDTFKTEDFTNLEHWHTDTLTLPFAEHYHAASTRGGAVSPVHANTR
jgi:hypothetical protein